MNITLHVHVYTCVYLPVFAVQLLLYIVWVILYVLYSPHSYSSNSAVLLLNRVSTLQWPVLKVYSNMHDLAYALYRVCSYGCSHNHYVIQLYSFLWLCSYHYFMDLSHPCGFSGSGYTIIYCPTVIFNTLRK